MQETNPVAYFAGEKVSFRWSMAVTQVIEQSTHDTNFKGSSEALAGLGRKEKKDNLAIQNCHLQFDAHSSLKFLL